PVERVRREHDAVLGRGGGERVLHGIVRSPVIPETFPTWAAQRFSVKCPMALVVSVPLNTMLADLDETLRSLLKRELERHGFDGVEIAFDAPAREWSSQLSSPTVNLFLYDLRESQDSRPNEWQNERGS